jgi:uncharacterized protein YyaL (SSP411 family)
MPNRLADAASPYLRQHADNPVDWYEWGDEPFALARERGVPVFLSVGYASCHWCHVMAHESFEDDTVARALNEGFVSIKVDREERPDVDAVYMGAVQALTGHGGWPMSVFLTPEGEPFFGGTYWPRSDRQGMPGFLKVLEAVGTAWSTQRDEVVDSGRRLAAHLAQQQDLGGGEDGVDPGLADDAAELCVRAEDRRHGGFGSAPKFPQAMVLDFLLAHALRTGDEGARDTAARALAAMARGGISDQVGGGFHRYSVDAAWAVPHFEKMLYDNALLLRAYLHGWQVTGAERFRRVAERTAGYLLDGLRQPEGGYSSSTDADSEGEEGRYFVWPEAEFREVVAAAGEDPDRWAERFGVTAEGQLDGANVLHEAEPWPEGDAAFDAALARVRAALAARRATRVPPDLDDKVLTGWNALALGALAETGAALGRADLVRAAADCARFLRAELVVSGRLRHAWRRLHGARVPAFLEDVAALAQALLVLYEADGDPAWFAWARYLADEAEERFADPDVPGTYWATAHDAERLVTRPKDLWDNATPAGPSTLVDVNLRLAALTGEGAHADRAERTLAAYAGRAAQAPTGYGELLRGLERRLSGPREVAIVGPDRAATAPLSAVFFESWRPGAVLAVGAPGAPGVPLLADRPLVDGAAAAYVCRDFACDRPVTTPDELRALLAR